jgi:predicted negative regulator of RcsB-dependent stress response
MARKITQKELKHDEFVEAAFDLGHWFEEHWKRVAQWLAAVALLAIAIGAWVTWSNERQERAKQRLAAGIERYQAAHATTGGPDAVILAESLETLDEAAGSLGGTPAGRLAGFYRGAALADLGRTEEARTALRQVVAAAGPDETVGGTARWMLARVELAAGRSDDAVALLNELLERSDSIVPPGQVLSEMARLHEAAGRPDEARRHWQRILDEQPQSPEAAEARERLR